MKTNIQEKNEILRHVARTAAAMVAGTKAAPTDSNGKALPNDVALIAAYILAAHTVKNNRSVQKRIEKMQGYGYEVRTVSMGPGGVLQYKETRNEHRIQLSYGWARNNAAHVVIIKK